MTLQERLCWIRHEFGSRGAWTSLRAFAEECGVNYRSWYSWESEGRQPRLASEALAAALAKLERVRARGVDPEALAAWALTGVGERPSGAPPVASATPAAPGFPPDVADALAGSLRTLVRGARAPELNRQMAEPPRKPRRR